MANPIIKIKRGVGTPASLSSGELAIDITNKNLFIGDNASVPFIIGGEGTFATKTYADSAVSTSNTTLQSAIDAEKARIDAILSAADADKDSFAEIVTLINNVDTENDTAFAGYVLSNDAALAQEVTDRTTADTTLQTNIDNEVTRATAAEGVNATAISQETTDRIADVDAEETRALAAEGALDLRVTALETTIDGGSY
jgi:putative methionine-R-sulfoxide reductase with GAF domain